MKCNSCQDNDANIRITAYINGEEKTFHLCSDCAEEMINGKNILPSYDRLIQAVFSLTEEPAVEGTEQNEGLISGKTEALLTGLIESMFRQMDGRKEPAKRTVTQVIENLEPKPVEDYHRFTARLKAAIEAEDYIEAAKWRDELNRLKEK